MRTLSILFLLVVFMASIASAELLTTANTNGQGKFAVEGVWIQDSNLMNLTDWTATSYGGYVSYGVLDNLDVILQYGIASVGGIPAAWNTEITGTAMGLALKYGILKEGADMPVSVAAAAQYKSISTTTKTTGAPDDKSDGSQMAIGFGVSKIIVPFVPYAGVAYRTDSADSTEQSTQIDITIGTAIAWSEQGAVLIEYTSQSITDKVSGAIGGDHTSGQIAAGIAYRI